MRNDGGHIRGDISAARVARLYQSGLSIKSVAAKLGCSRTLVVLRLKEAGCATRPTLQFYADRKATIREAAARLKAKAGH